MQVLKFGGTSVASSEAMLQVVDIVRKALEEDRTIVVSSAIHGCTDALIETGRRAAAHDETYKDLIAKLRDQHHRIIGELLPEGYRERTAAMVDKLFASLEGITYGPIIDDNTCDKEGYEMMFGPKSVLTYENIRKSEREFLKVFFNYSEPLSFED